MKLTLLDTKTGKTKSINDIFNAFWWAEGNGSCDCNRAPYFPGANKELNKQQRIDHPELKEWQSYCFGCNRILIIKADSKEYTLKGFNKDYPRELIEKHIKE